MISERIKELRKDQKLSQTAFGERIGVGLGVIKNIEQKVVAAKEPFLKALIAEFDINEKWLRNGEGEMYLATNDKISQATWNVLLSGNPTQISIFEELRNMNDLSEEDLQFLLTTIRFLKAQKKTTS